MILNRSEKDRHHMLYLTCGIFKKMIQIYLQNGNRLTDLDFMVTNREVGEAGGGINQEIGIKSYTKHCI